MATDSKAIIPQSKRSRPGGRSSADERRRQVVWKAAQLFDLRGYQNTTVSDIATASQLGKSTLYHYFSSKEEILFWIHEEFIDLLIERQERRLGTRMPASQLLLEVMGDILELMDSHPGHVRVFFEHYREVSPERQASIRAKRRRYADLVEQILTAGVSSGEFRPVDVRLGALAVFGMCNWAYQWYRREGPLRSREIAYAFWDIAVRGFGSTDGEVRV